MHNNIQQEEFAAFCQNLAQKLDLEINDTALASLSAYLELLLKWNEKINLTGARTWQEALANLVADSFYLADFISTLPLAKNPETWDLGAGAGLPGIPLRILWQEGSYYMVELRQKRALFLSTALAHLKLPATFTHLGKAEDFMQKRLNNKHPANCIISRAFMPWQKLTELVKPFLSPAPSLSPKKEGLPTGILLLMLNGDSFTEYIPGWAIINQMTYNSPGGARQFVALQPLQPLP